MSQSAGDTPKSAVVLVDEDSNNLSIFLADTLFWSYEAVKAFVKREVLDIVTWNISLMLICIILAI